MNPEPAFTGSQFLEKLCFSQVAGLFFYLLNSLGTDLVFFFVLATQIQSQMCGGHLASVKHMHLFVH